MAAPFPQVVTDWEILLRDLCQLPVTYLQVFLL